MDVGRGPFSAQSNNMKVLMLDCHFVGEGAMRACDSACCHATAKTGEGQSARLIGVAYWLVCIVFGHARKEAFEVLCKHSKGTKD